MARRLRAALLTALTLSALTAGAVFAAPPEIDPTPLPNGNRRRRVLRVRDRERRRRRPARVPGRRGQAAERPSAAALVRRPVGPDLRARRPARGRSRSLSASRTRPCNTDVGDVLDGDRPAAAAAHQPQPDTSCGTVGEPYAANLFAIGGIQPYCWAVVAGAVPDGLDLKGWFRMPARFLDAVAEIAVGV